LGFLYFIIQYYENNENITWFVRRFGIGYSTVGYWS